MTQPEAPFFYRAFVEAVADRMFEEGLTEVPADALARAADRALGVDTFEQDVLAEFIELTFDADPRQYNLPL